MLVIGVWFYAESWYTLCAPSCVMLFRDESYTDAREQIKSKSKTLTLKGHSLAIILCISEASSLLESEDWSPQFLDGSDEAMALLL